MKDLTYLSYDNVAVCTSTFLDITVQNKLRYLSGFSTSSTTSYQNTTVTFYLF